MTRESIPDRGELGMTMLEHGGIRAMTRDGTSDKFVFQEVVKDRSYRKLTVGPTDIVLDAGMNIGMFTVTALKQGAMVFGFEPAPANYNLAVENVRINGFSSGFELSQKAVTGTDDPVRNFAINLQKNKGAHSLIARRGRGKIQVQCENINTILRRIRPTVIKMDTEGGEYECIKAAESFDGVREFQFEFHHEHLRDIKTRKKRDEILGILRGHFRTVEAKLDTKGAWVSLFYCANR